MKKCYEILKSKATTSSVWRICDGKIYFILCCSNILRDANVLNPEKFINFQTELNETLNCGIASM